MNDQDPIEILTKHLRSEEARAKRGLPAFGPSTERVWTLCLELFRMPVPESSAQACDKEKS